MATGLIALLDDVAALAKIAAASLDDAAAQAVKAGSKAAGIVIDDAAVTPTLVPPDRVDQVLQRVEGLALAPHEEFALLATDVHADAIGIGARRDRDVQAHGPDDVADELCDLLVENGLRAHDSRCPGTQALAGLAGGPTILLVRYC